MGVPLTEFVVEAVLRRGLEEIRANPVILEEIFEDYNDAYLQETYGVDHIQKIKDYIINSNLHIIQSWPRDEAKMPCVSINSVGSDEAPNREFFSDYIGDNSESETPSTSTQTFIPTGYANGFIRVSNSVDLANVSAGQLFVDGSDDQFTILSVNNTTGNKKIGIDSGSNPDVADYCFVRYNNEEKRYNKKQISFTERVVLGIHAINDPKELKYWYYVVLYIIHSKRDIFEQKGYQLHVSSASDFNRLVELVPREYFNRFVNINFLAYLSWTGDRQELSNDAGINIRVEKDVVEIPPSSGKSIITTP